MGGTHDYGRLSMESLSFRALMASPDRRVLSLSRRITVDAMANRRRLCKVELSRKLRFIRALSCEG